MKTLIENKEEKIIADELYEAIKKLPKEQLRDVKVMIMTAKILFEDPPKESVKRETAV